MMPLMSEEKKTVTVPEAADILGVSGRQVRNLIEGGSLRAKQYGRSWIIRVGDLKLVENRKVGRPRKEA